jgi:hypothetical protein
VSRDAPPGAEAIPVATREAAARSDAIDAIVRVLDINRPVRWRIIAADVYDAVAPVLQAEAAASERARLAALAVKHGAQCYQRCTDADCGGHLTAAAHSHHLADFADLIATHCNPELTPEPDEPLIDPDCRDGKHTSCVGGPCECSCHVK